MVEKPGVTQNRAYDQGLPGHFRGKRELSDWAGKKARRSRICRSGKPGKPVAGSLCSRRDRKTAGRPPRGSPLPGGTFDRRIQRSQALTQRGNVVIPEAFMLDAPRKRQEPLLK